MSQAVFIGHNAASFDGVVLNRLWSLGLSLETQIIDTLVLSYLYNPALVEGHSLEAWGIRLKFPKGDFSDWSVLSDDMIRYCRNDVTLCLKVYLALSERMTRMKFSEKSCQIEHKIRITIDEQIRNGFYFHKAKAHSFRQELRDKQKEITESLQKLFPPTRIFVATRELYKINGEYTKQYEKDRERYELEISDTSYDCYEYEPFNIGSPKQRVERLLGLGWEPQKFTKKGFPKVDEDALVAFADVSGRPEVAALAEWLVLQGRASMLDTWFNNLGEDSRIHGKIITCGATTRRMTHNSPNTANIPSGSKAKYGHECRSFWGVEPDRGLVLVGYDAAGLETAGLCHYLNNPIATEILLRPKPDDIHTANSRRLTEALNRDIDRETAKTAWYAWLYGAYPKKLGEIVKGPPEDGDVVIETFYRNVPGLKKLIQDVQDEFYNNNGRLETIDGGFVLCPSKSSALNYRVQSLGSILMKLTSIILREDAKSLNIPFKLVGSIHDEGQLETRKEYAEVLGNLSIASIEKASKELKLNVLVTGDYKIGLSWNETH